MPPTRPAALTLETLQVPDGNADVARRCLDRHRLRLAPRPTSGPDLLSVFNGATCNANSTSGCNQLPATLYVGDSAARSTTPQLNIAVNQATNTIYATNIADFNTGNLVDSAVYVINGAICDAPDTTGCGTESLSS